MFSMSEIENAIQVSAVSKTFKLPHEKVSSIKNIFTNAIGYIRKRRTYEVQQALSDISFEVKKGEFFGIVGRNGSGKSTLLKMLAGIYQPTKGLIEISGRLVPFIELGVGFSPELTGRENVFLNGALLGFSKKEITEQYDEIVDFAELEPFMDQKLKNYSSGMQVRLAFSMAVRAKADVLLIDEVLAVGDADFQRKCFDYFKKLKKDKVTVVLVTHDMEAVREYCDRAMLIEKSKIIDIGSTSDIAEKYLKLFSKNSQQFDNKKSQNSNRWGDGTVISEDISMAVEMDSISINQNITVNNELKGFVAGFRLRDSAGKEITGTNTKIEGVKLPLLISGSQASIVWKFPNILSEGNYTVDLAILHADAVTVADWWDEAVKFNVSRARHVPYSIYPGFEITVSKSK